MNNGLKTLIISPINLQKHFCTKKAKILPDG